MEKTIIAYTFIRLSYQYNANKPHLASKPKLYSKQENCHRAMKDAVDLDFKRMSALSNVEDWAYKYIDIDECSGRAEYEIRAYETQDHDSDFVVFYQYIMYPIYSNIRSNYYEYRGFNIIAVAARSDKKGIITEFRAVKGNIDIDMGPAESISELLYDINHFLLYIDYIGNNKLFKEEDMT